MAPRNRTNIEKEGVQDLERGKSIAPPFLTKTHLLVQDPTTDDIISWNSEGTGFVVWKPTELARDLLPTIFKHCNFSSFVRQLNTYGFRKIVPGRWEFYNEKFQRDKHDLLFEIKRRKTWASTKTPASTSSTPEINNRGLNLNSPLMDSDEDRESLSTSSSEYDSLCEENARLRGDNEVLCLELQRMKNKCKELLDLVSACVDRNEEEEEEEKERPKLFGVRLELAPEQRKRKRSRVVAEEILKNTNFLKIVAPMQAQMHA